MLWITFLITAIITTLIVWGAHWIEKKRMAYPALYRNRRLIGFIVYLILNSGDIPK